MELVDQNRVGIGPYATSCHAVTWALDYYLVDDITAEVSFYLIIHRPHHVGHLVSTPILLMVISSSVPLLVNIDLEPADYIGVSGSEQELPQQ